jgi:hypothetical protein
MFAATNFRSLVNAISLASVQRSGAEIMTIALELSAGVTHKGYTRPGIAGKPPAARTSFPINPYKAPIRGLAIPWIASQFSIGGQEREPVLRGRANNWRGNRRRRDAIAAAAGFQIPGVID